MSKQVRVSDVRFVAASASEIEQGLLGWVSCVVNGSLCLDGITVRRTLSRGLRLSFPSKRDTFGEFHFYVKPRGDRARRVIEAQIFRALGLEEVARR